PSSNGAPISGYIVQWDGGAQECGSTTCTVTGLTNDTVYNFEVVAVNEVGESNPSPPSIDARPDVRPEQPSAPSAERGDRELDVSWEQPENRGSRIEFYILQISPGAPDGTTQVEVESTNFTWTGLHNGTEYRFSVQAHNNADEPSEWSRESAGEIPAGPPTAPTNVSATPQQLGGSTNQVAVTWGASDDNGSAIEHYTVVPYRNGTALTELSREVAPPSNSTTVRYTYESLPVHEDAYTFEVFATNDVSDGESATSSPIRIVNAPEAPALQHLADRDRAAQIRITPGALNGYRAGEVSYEYRVGSGDWQSIGTGDQVISNLSNAQQTVQVRAVAESDGVSNTGDVASVQVSPYGAPPKASISAIASTTGVTFNWSLNGENGRPIDQVQTRQRIGNGSWSGWQDRNGTSGNPTVDGNAGQTIQMQIRVRDSEEQWSETPHASASGTVEESSRLWVTQGADRCIDGSCGPTLVLNYEGIESGTYEFRCWHSSGGYFHTGYDVSLASSGTALDGSDRFCFYNGHGEVRIDLFQNGSRVYEGEERSWTP
ncbi:fibronectin type III domain-containing protein, partial [uncultured Agrococcus sp.]|uniref:fibronectin type III domain-containing protein n=1 Tax=uncultured Agrococcus sp. TaxID=382258 RepID=UPI0025CE718F